MRGAHLGREVSLLGLLVAIGGLYYGVDTFGPGLLAARGEVFVASAAVSISAAIPANPDNTLAQQLREKQEALDARERSLGTQSSGSTDWGFRAFALSVLLLILMFANFYLDMRRARRLQDARTYSIALRP
jgi:hypothetical protein